MTGTSPRETPSSPMPFLDFAQLSAMNGNFLAETGKLNARMSVTLQNMGKEWVEFVGARLTEDNHLLHSLRDCKSMSEAEQVYAQFWQTAFKQYGEEAQRLVGIAQSAMEETTNLIQQIPAEVQQERH